MKTKFEISSEIFGSNRTIQEGIDFYKDEDYEKEGFLLDEDNEEVYKIYEKEINLKEGDRVTFYGYRIVEWKCIDFLNNTIIYCLRRE